MLRRDQAGKQVQAKKSSTAESEDIIISPTHCYGIIEFLTIFSALASYAICKECRHSIIFEETGNCGLV